MIPSEYYHAFALFPHYSVVCYECIYINILFNRFDMAFRFIWILFSLMMLILDVNMWCNRARSDEHMYPEYKLFWMPEIQAVHMARFMLYDFWKSSFSSHLVFVLIPLLALTNTLSRARTHTHTHVSQRFRQKMNSKLFYYCRLRRINENVTASLNQNKADFVFLLRENDDTNGTIIKLSMNQYLRTHSG